MLTVPGVFKPYRVTLSDFSGALAVLIHRKLDNGRLPTEAIMRVPIVPIDPTLQITAPDGFTRFVLFDSRLPGHPDPRIHGHPQTLPLKRWLRPKKGRMLISELSVPEQKAHNLKPVFLDSLGIRVFTACVWILKRVRSRI